MVRSLRENEIEPGALHHLGVPDRFLGQASREEVLDRAGLSARGIAAQVRELIPPRMNPIP